MIDDSFPSQGTEQPSSSGSQSTAPDAPTTPQMELAKGQLRAKMTSGTGVSDYGSATSSAYRRGDYSQGTHSPWHPNEK